MRNHRTWLETSRKARTTALAILLAWMWIGPIQSQIFGPKTRWLRSWTMYSGVGLGLRDVRFFDGSNGGMKRLDWPSIPAQTGGYVEPGPHQRLINSDEKFQHVVGELCAQLGPEADLRAIVRVRSGSTWRTRFSGKRNLCQEGVGDR